MGNGIYFKIAGQEDLDMLQIFAIISYSFWNIGRKVFFFYFNLMKKGQKLQDGAHLCNLNLTSTSYSFWNITQKVSK